MCIACLCEWAGVEAEEEGGGCGGEVRGEVLDAKCGLERVEMVIVQVEGGVVKRQAGLGGRGEDEAF